MEVAAVRVNAQDSGDQAGRLDARLAAAAERLGHASRLLLRAAAARHGLSIIQAQLLLRLASDSTGAHSSVAAMTMWFDVRQPTISDAVTALERKKLIVKIRDKGRQRLRLTAAGQAAAADLGGWDAPLRAALTEHPAEAQGTALAVMLSAIAGLQAAGIVTVARSCTTCRFFRPAAHPNRDAPHHCALLDLPLRLIDLRLDCPEHQPAAA
jgi:DNA-binding MarR family transcriptional regulator